MIGATALSGDGCFMAEWGCPKHKGPADGHIVTTGHIFRDTYAEQNVGAAMDEGACLRRAIAQWRYCGSYSNHPITSIFRPTGLYFTAYLSVCLYEYKGRFWTNKIIHKYEITLLSKT